MKQILFSLLLLVTVREAYSWTLIGAGIQGWQTRRLTFYVNPSNCSISEADLLDLVDHSFAVWNGVPTADFTVVRAPENSTMTPAEYLAGGNSQVPVIFCDPDFATNIGSEDVVPAATQWNFSSSILNTGAIFLNAQSGAGAEIKNVKSGVLRVIIAHEAGHIFGLGHSRVPESLMHYSVSGKDEARLSEDDMLGLSFLYPRNELKYGAFGCGSVHRSGTEPYSLLMAASFLFGLLVLGRVCFPRTAGRQ